MKRLAVLVFFIAFLPRVLRAEDAKLNVVYAEGKGFVLVRGGKSQYVDFAAQSPVGMELKAGDTVNLEARSALELQLFPTLTVLKALASSSFTVKAVYGNGNVDLDVAFGRLRTKTDDRIASGEFLYNGVEIATGAGGADFGFDLVFAAGNKLAPVVSCLAGALQVAKTAAASSTVGATALAAKEMVTVGAGGRSTFQKSRLAADIDRFWQKNDFKTRPSRAATTPPETKVARNESPSPSPTPKESLTTPRPSPTPKPESKSANSAEAGRTLSRNGVATPPLVNNTENALGAREKLSAVSEKDIVVNPDFAKSGEKAAVPPPSPAPEVKKDVTPAKTEETQPAPTPQPQPAPAPAQPGPSPIGFYLGVGLEVNYLPVFPAPEVIMPGLDALKGLFDIVNKLEAGALVDADIMFFNIVGVGVETGIRYHMLVTQEPFPSLAPVFNHLINIPIFANIRLSLFVAFVQVYGGVYIPGGVFNGNLEFHPETLMYEMGAKAGAVLGGMVLYATISLSATSIANLFTTSSCLQVGGGLAFKIF